MKFRLPDSSLHRISQSMGKPHKFEHPICEECGKKLTPWKLGPTREEWLWNTCDTCMSYVCEDCSDEDPETGKVTCSSCLQTEAWRKKDSMVIRSDISNIPTAEMEKHFEDRTKKHISLVQKYCGILEDEMPDLKGINERGKIHDDSKFEDPEHTPYIWLTWRYKCKDDGVEFVGPDGIDKKIDKATEHHILNNSHHPEMHQDKKTDLLNSGNRDEPPEEMIDATKMSKLDLAEMVADWCAMSEERGNTPQEWADKNVNIRWKFTDKQKKLIYDMMNVIWKDDNKSSKDALRRVSMVIRSQYEPESEFRFDPNSTINEGRWRLQDPKIFGKYFRRKSSTPGISYVMGVDDHGRAIIQAIRFDKNTWSEEEVAAWWESNKDRYDKVWTQTDWNNLSGEES